MIAAAKPFSRRQQIMLIVIVLLGAWLRLHGLDAVEMIGDEPQDLAILSNNTTHGWIPFQSSSLGDQEPWDQSRMTFALSSAASRITGQPILRASRWVSIVGALLGIVVVFYFGQELFGAPAGLIAAFCQSVSIYDIGFSRLGLTSSMSWCVSFFLLSLFCFYRAIKTSECRWYYAAGAAAGISMAAKLFGVFAFFIYGAWFVHARFFSPFSSKTKSKDTLPVAMLTSLVLCIAALSIIAWSSWDMRLKSLFFAISTLGMISAHFYIFHKEPLRAIENPKWAFVLMALTASAYFFIYNPVHLDPHHLLSVFKWVPEWHNAAWVKTTAWDFVPILLIRLNWPFNLLWILSCCYFIFSRHCAAHRLLLMAFIIPLAILSLSRWKLTWYLLVLFPIGYLMIASFMVSLWEMLKLRSRFMRLLLTAALTASGVIYFFQMHYLAPYYEIDGYRLGRSWIGWDKPSFVTFEKLHEVVRWLESQIPQGKTVTVFLIDNPVYNDYSFRALLAERSHLRPEFQQAKAVKEIGDSEFVVTSIYSETTHAQLMSQGYFQVKTFFLLDLPYATVWSKLPNES